MFKSTGKLFGKISIIDIAVLLIIILVCVGVVSKFGGEKVQIISKNEKLICVLKVEGVRDYTVDAIKKSKSVFNEKTKEKLGDIIDIKTEPGKTMLLVQDGAYKEVETAGRSDVYLTIEVEGKITDSGYYTGSNTQMATGSSVGITTKYAECDTKIMSVEKAE